ncbi:MAG: hypothetical protein QM681_17440 [Novosphingobium sp.]
MDRRSLITRGLATVVAVGAAPTAFAAPAAADAAIVAAWDRRAGAYSAYWALGDTSRDYPAEHRLMVIVDEAEAVIRAATATTPIGVEMQIWTALYHFQSGSLEDDAASLRRDLAYFEAKNDDLDWNEGLLISAIRSVRRLAA